MKKIDIGFHLHNFYVWFMGKMGIEIEPRLTPEELAEGLDLNDISKENILKSFTKGKYVYSKTYDRIYQVVGDRGVDSISYPDTPHDPINYPTILVDVWGWYEWFFVIKSRKYI
jgi:hypothetical protein